MQFVNEHNYPEVTIEQGLAKLMENPSARLYSDGLKFDEYMYYNPNLNGICYEDDGFIGKNDEDAAEHLLYWSNWTKHHKFYLYEPKIGVIDPATIKTTEIKTAVIAINRFTEKTQKKYFTPMSTGNGTIEFPPKTLPEPFTQFFDVNGNIILYIKNNIATNNILPKDLKDVIDWAQTQNIQQIIFTK